MPTSEFEKKIHRWASLICCFGSYRCLVRVGSICNLLELDLQMPGRGRKHLQLAGIGFVDAWSGSEASATCWNWICRCLVGVGSICNLLELDLQMPGRGRKHLQFVGYEFADTYPGVGSICNLLKLELQMPGRGWKHLQLAEIGFADTYRGELRTWKHLQLAGIGFADAWSGLEASATCWNWICRCLVRIGSICNLLVLELQMPGRGWKHPQLAGYEFADAYHQVDIKNPTTIAVGLFFMSKKEQNVLVDLRSILC